MGYSYRAVGKTFRNEKSIAVSITHGFYKELSKISRRFIGFQNPEMKLAVQSRTLKKRPIVQFRRLLELTTALILKHYLQQMRIKKDYFSRKQCHTVNTQAAIGTNLKILDLVTRFPGSIHDVKALKKHLSQG